MRHADGTRSIRRTGCAHFDGSEALIGTPHGAGAHSGALPISPELVLVDLDYRHDIAVGDGKATAFGVGGKGWGRIL